MNAPVAASHSATLERRAARVRTMVSDRKAALLRHIAAHPGQTQVELQRALKLTRHQLSSTLGDLADKLEATHPSAGCPARYRLKETG